MGEKTGANEALGVEGKEMGETTHFIFLALLRADRRENSDTLIRRTEAIHMFTALGREGQGSKHWHSD